MVISHFIRKPKIFLETLPSLFLPGSHWSNWIIWLVKGNHTPGLGYTKDNHLSGISSRLRDLQYKLNKVEFSYKRQEEGEQCQVHTFSSVPCNFCTLYHSDLSAWLFALGVCKFVETNYILIFMDLVFRTVPLPQVVVIQSIPFIN